MFEIDTLNLAILKATDKDVENLQVILDKFETEFKAGNYHEAAELDYEFHKTMVKVTRNRLFEKLVLAVYDFFFKSIERTIISYEVREQKVSKVHGEMLDCTKSRDNSRVAEIVESSLEGWKNYV